MNSFLVWFFYLIVQFIIGIRCYIFDVGFRFRILVDTLLLSLCSTRFSVVRYYIFFGFFLKPYVLICYCLSQYIKHQTLRGVLVSLLPLRLYANTYSYVLYISIFNLFPLDYIYIQRTR